MTDLWILLAVVLAGTSALLFWATLRGDDRPFLEEDEDLIETLGALKRMHRPGGF